MNKLVSIIIINWNGKEHLQICLPSLSRQTYKNIEIIVVDNGSSDGSVEYIKKNFPHIILVLNKKNLGFAEANNIGYLQTKGDFVLFLNNDTKVTENFLTPLVNIFKNDQTIGGVQSKIFYMDDKNRLDAVASYLTPLGILFYIGVGKKDSYKYDHPLDMYSAKGACVLVRKDVLESVLLENEIFDSRFFAYFEETDLCHRIWLRGFRVVYEPTSIIYHKVGGTSTRFGNAFLQYHSFKNRINSYIKNLSFINLLKILPLHLILCEMFAAVCLLRFQLHLFWSIQKAIYWNILQMPTTLRKRQYINKKIRLKRDDEFFPIIMKTPKLNYYLNLFSGLKNYEDE